MVRVLFDQNGRREFAVSEDDLDFFGEVMGRVMRPQLPMPTAQAFQPLPEAVLLPSPPQQHLLMPGPEVLPEPDPRIMPGYVAPTQRLATFEPVRLKRLGIVQIAIALALANKRYLMMGGLAFSGAIFLWFAGSFVVRKVAPEATVEVGPIEAIGDPKVEGVEEAPPAEEKTAEEAPAEPPPEEKPAVQFPTFPAIPR